MKKTEKLRVDASWYDPHSTEPLMRKRGIVKDRETVSDALSRVVHALCNADTELEGNADEQFLNDVAYFTEKGIFVYGTPILTNAGRGEITTAACTVIPLPVRQGLLEIDQFRERSLESLDAAIGTGYDLSTLANPTVELHRMNETINEINLALLKAKKRPVACMATLRADHPDILNFISAKNDADFTNWRFNISVWASEKLFEQAKRNSLWNLHDNEGRAVGQIPAQELLQRIATNAHYCGEPGLLFKDRYSRDNATPQWEYESTAPCAEVAMAAGEVCQFSYINLAELWSDSGQGPSFDFDQFQKSVRTMTRLLDASVQITIDFDPLHSAIIGAKRRIGVGVTGFAGLLLRLGIPYASPEAEKLAYQISETLAFASKTESVELATRRGVFPAFLDSRYTNKSWLRRHRKKSTGIISNRDWELLYQSILKSGIRNASTTAFPPTGTSSQIASTSTSFEPYFSLVSYKYGYPQSPDTAVPVITRDVLSALQVVAKNPQELAELIRTVYDPTNQHQISNVDQYPTLATARQISLDWHLRIQAAFQAFADEAGSKTINLPNHAQPEDVMAVLFRAYELGLKGVTVFRDNCLNERTCAKR